jgi:hypothetical protein
MLLEDGDLNRCYSLVIHEIRRLVDDEDVVVLGRVVYKEFSSPYYIISRVGRMISSRYDGYLTILVNKGFFRDRDQVYIRANGIEFDYRGFIRYALDMGYAAGGKEGVMGVLVPKGETNDFIEYILGRYGK